MVDERIAKMKVSSGFYGPTGFYSPKNAQDYNCIHVAKNLMFAPVHYRCVVVDANAIINAGSSSLFGIADTFVTTPEVMNEIRDARARQVLDTIQFSIDTRTPSEDQINSVIQFAKKTGDFATLSKNDITLIALARQIEQEYNGATHIRTEPLLDITTVGLLNPSILSPPPEKSTIPCKFYTSETGCRAGSKCEFFHDPNATNVVVYVEKEVDQSSLPAAQGGDVPPPLDDTWEVVPRKSKGQRHAPAPKKPLQSLSSAPLGGGLERVSMQESNPTEVLSVSTPVPLKDVDLFGSEIASSGHVRCILEKAEDDDGDWIMPAAAPLPTESIGDDGADSRTEGSFQAEDEEAVVAALLEESSKSSTKELNRIPVACITSDYAMQNLILQMNLQLATMQGKLVSSVKSWVLKCDACFTITTKVDKLFCPRCGNAALQRLGVTLGHDGRPRYHYKARRQFNVRGTQFALPAPTGGRNPSLLLREDQLLVGAWAQKAKMKQSADSMFSDAVREVRGVNTIARSDIQVGLGRRNPNEARRRRK
jgi:RNA-binding protein NOB1